MLKILFTLQAARINLGYTQKDVSRLLNVNVNTIVNWEKDSSNLTFKRIKQFSSIYHIPKDMIFFGNKNEFIRNYRKNENKLIKT
ncbi:XRE family transcriptional regulator [Apilactobacillus timberlakei]|uniref:XRE family transcriptional regulator n=1 Tax=Apilactobacillus timberlakei TaxID=2008380 RepID=A0ABY2YRE7_9LACO|nr:XRE family transcriptional regulator [Apilactobacillus timberlakei]TPR13678.1 XRE family transcriptional regulator [Apilactobacillus timberlakei]